MPDTTRREPGKHRQLPSTIVIRRAADGDLESLWRCIDSVARERRFLGMTTAPPLSEFMARFRAAWAGGMMQLVAVIDAGVVGWCDVLPLTQEGFTHTARLGMGVVAAHRGRGIGAALLDRTIETAHEAGFTRIELEVLESNEAAVMLYRTRGFAEEGRKRRARVLDGRTEDLICMALLR